MSYKDDIERNQERERKNGQFNALVIPPTVTLVDTKEAITMLARGFKQTLKTEATHFCSVKKNGEEFNVYMRQGV